MKKLIFLLLGFILITVAPNSFGQYTKVVCIDPGHGGPGAWKYGSNGDGEGASGPNGLTEEWVNLQVSLKLRELTLSYWAYLPVVIMTRTEDTAYRPRDRRAEIANFANGPRPWDPFDGVRDFISVHHNGLGPNLQGVETFWCDAMQTDSGWWRDTDRLLAYKPYLRLIDVFEWPPYDPRDCKETCFDVLRLTTMSSVLSEATNIGTAAEESLFANENSGHADTEAVALCNGYASFVEDAGIAIVKNAYSTGSTSGSGGIIGVGDGFWSWDTVDSPYERCWRNGESHYLVAFTPQVINGYEYTFHHWTHLNANGQQIGDDWYYPTWSIMVGGEIDYHRYVAYFHGGPYSDQVVSPNGWEIWRIGEQREILWNVSVGADSTSRIDVFIDRDGGSGGYTEQIANDVWTGWNGISWTVTGPYSTHCRIKIVAEDVVGNSAWDVSDYDFSISASGNNNPEIDQGLHCKYAQTECNDCIKWGESITLEVHAHDDDHDSMYYEWYACCSSFAGHFSNGYDTMTTAQNYVVYTAPAKAESPGEGGEGENLAPEVYLKATAIDVRGGSNFTFGYLGIYDPPVTCLCGDVKGDDGRIGLGDVTVLISYLYKGGPRPPDPIDRADVNNDCVVGMGDLVYLINYLYKGGSPPACCWIHL